MKDGSRARGGVIFLVALASVLAAAETVLYFVRPDLRDPTYFRAAGRPLTQYDEDPELFWKDRNSYFGFEQTIARAQERNRVYVFGGSIAVGLAVPLADVLKEQGLDVLTMNMAGGGWTTHQSLVQQRRYFAVRPPTHAILCNAFNDAQPAEMDYAAQARRNRTFARRTLYLLNRSRLFTLYRRGLGRALGAGRSPDRLPAVCVPLDQYRRNLAAFAERCREDGVLAVFVTQQFPANRFRDQTAPYLAAMEEVAAQTGALFVDVRAALAGEMERLGIPVAEENEARNRALRGALWADGIHPNEHGYRIMARLVYERVQAAGGWRR